MLKFAPNPSGNKLLSAMNFMDEHDVLAKIGTEYRPDRALKGKIQHP